jgi:hypothetical protein
MRETVQVERQRRSTSSGTGRPEESDGKRPIHFEVSGKLGCGECLLLDCIEVG